MPLLKIAAVTLHCISYICIFYWRYISNFWKALCLVTHTYFWYLKENETEK